MNDNLYPVYLTWRADLRPSMAMAELFGKHQAQRITKALQRLAAANQVYSFRVEEIGDNFLDEFIPLYEQHIGAKRRGTVFDVRAKIKAAQERGKVYEAVALR